MTMHTGEQLLEMMRDYQMPCILAAAADWDLFNMLAGATESAEAIARSRHADVRAMTVLLDALASIRILEKSEAGYALVPELVPLLSDNSPSSVAPMIRHQANCLRRWARLPWVVQTGRPATDDASIQGREADNASFIGAMDVVSKAVADELVGELAPGPFRCLLDIGGASGTWTASWLKANPAASAILFDLPDVIPLARQNLQREGLLDRVRLVAGDYHTDDMPPGADLAWVSAIIHQNSRAENRALFARIASALQPQGRVLIRDVVMEEGRTQPLAGALFAVNMLVATDGGGTYTLAETRDDLQAAGFRDVELIRRHEAMHSVVQARRAE